MSALENTAARSEFICLVAEQEAEEKVFEDRDSRQHGLLVRAGVREAWAMIGLEEDWERRKLK